MSVEFFNFPIYMLKDLHSRPKQALSNILNFCLYRVFKELEGTKAKRLKDAAEHLGVTFGNAECALEEGENLQFFSKPMPFTGIERVMYWEFHKKENWSEFEFVALSAFLAVKSIVGKNAAFKTNKKMVLSRMIGFVKPCSQAEENPVFQKYIKRYHWEHLRDELECSWNIRFFSNHNRGFYVSTSVSYSELAKIVYENKKKSKLAAIRQAKKAALLEVSR